MIAELDLCNLHLRTLKKREACEFVIWGKCLSDTIDEIAFFEQQKQAKINEAIRLNLSGEGNPAID